MQTLTELFQAIDKKILSGASLLECQPLVESYQGQDWQSLCQYQPDGFCRQSIMHNERFEFVLIGWEQGHDTGIHDHPEKGCLLRVLQGAFSEERFTKDGLSSVKSGTLQLGQVSFIQGNDILHKVGNIHVGRSASLHVYSPPHYVCLYYS